MSNKSKFDHCFVTLEKVFLKSNILKNMSSVLPAFSRMFRVFSRVQRTRLAPVCEHRFAVHSFSFTSFSSSFGSCVKPPQTFTSSSKYGSAFCPLSIGKNHVGKVPILTPTRDSPGYDLLFTSTIIGMDFTTYEFPSVDVKGKWRCFDGTEFELNQNQSETAARYRQWLDEGCAKELVKEGRKKGKVMQDNQEMNMDVCLPEGKIPDIEREPPPRLHHANHIKIPVSSADDMIVPPTRLQFRFGVTDDIQNEGISATEPVITYDEGAQIFLEFHQVLFNLSSLLHENNSSLSQILKTTLYVVDLNDSDMMHFEYIYGKALGPNQPPVDVVGVQALPAGAKVAISAIATMTTASIETAAPIPFSTAAVAAAAIRREKRKKGGYDLGGT